MNRNKKIQCINRCIRRLKNSVSTIEVIIGTNNVLKDSEYKIIISKSEIDSLLIADEVHNLGTDNFLLSEPNI